jgi:NAD(P)H-hydrate epimerase
VEGPAFSADATVTFQAAKLGHVLGEGPERSGELHIVDIGLPEPRPALRLCEEGDAPTPVRTRHAHKWSVGSVAVVCGSPGLTGAGLLAARSALGAGAGSACVVCPGALQSTYASLDPGVMSLGIGTGERFTADDAPNVLEAASRYGVLAIGPGLGTVEGAFVEQLLERWDGPVVLDADGLNALDGPSALTRDPDTVVTPHAGEFARLAGEAATHEAAERLAATTGATVLLKGNPTFVTDGGETWVVASGGPELATIGTGDVLTGMVGAFLAGGMPAPTAARAASYHHGVAGAELAEERTVTATALAEAIANAPRS